MRAPVTAAFALLAASLATPVLAKDDLLDVLAQKGVLTPEEYEKLKAQRRSEVTVSAEDGFKLSSADGSSTLQVGTLQQIDFAAYGDDKADLADGVDLRRSRLSIAGTFLKDWQYRVEYEFSGTTGITDAYVSYTARKPLLITAGQFKQPFGLDALAADKNISFMERGLPFAYVVTRAPGLMVSSSGVHWSAAAGVFGEPVGNAAAGDEGWGVVARGTWAPILAPDRLLHLGLGLSYRTPTQENSTNATGAKFSTVRFRSKPESNQLAQRFVDTGEIRGVYDYRIVGLELAALRGPASLQAEVHYVQVEREVGKTLDFNGWYGQLAYTLTGEVRSYKVERGLFEGIKPAHPLGKEGWGAFEVAARLSGIDLSDQDINGGREQNAAAALSWYPNGFVRVSANYVKVLDVKGGAMAGDEPSIYQLRLQLAL